MTMDVAQTVDDEAVHWFVLLRDEPTPEDRAACARWRAADPRHERAWRDVERMWGALDALPPHEVRAPRQARRIRWRQLAAAAALASAAWFGGQSLLPWLAADHRTGVGDAETFRLADGSHVDLGTASALDVDFNRRERRVTLKSGEAFFTVAPDASRPFVVATPEGEIRVLGTAFNVKIEDEVSVAVAHNSVEVRAAHSEPVVVREGESVRYRDGGVSAVEAADLEAVQAWREGKLIFRDVSLETVLRELGRYRYGEIVLLDGALRQKKVTAVFDTSRTQAAIETIARTLGLRVFSATPLLIALAPA